MNIEKEDGFDTLFFPFQEVNIAKEKLQLGDYMRLTEKQLLTTTLDCLIVVVPELKVG